MKRVRGGCSAAAKDVQWGTTRGDMKYKRIGFWLLIVLAVLLAAFNLYFHLQLDRHEDVHMAAVTETAHSTGVTVVLLNESGAEVESGNAHQVRLQRNLLGVWLPVRRDFTVGYTEEALCYAPHAWQQVELSWKGAYGEQGPGTYRVLKEFRIAPAAGMGERFWLSAEFTIPD